MTKQVQESSTLTLKVWSYIENKEDERKAKLVLHFTKIQVKQLQEIKLALTNKIGVENEEDKKHTSNWSSISPRYKSLTSTKSHKTTCMFMVKKKYLKVAIQKELEKEIGKIVIQT